jgi:hypothetical protein
MTERSDEPIEVLRGIWTARGQSSADLDEAFGPARSCKRMADIGFAGLAGDGESEGTGDLRAAWRATLRRDGKLSDSGGSIADLVLGQADGRD